MVQRVGAEDETATVAGGASRACTITTLHRHGWALRLQEVGAEGHIVPLASSRWKVEGLDQGLLKVEGAVGSYLPGSGAGTCVCPAWLASFGTLSS